MAIPLALSLLLVAAMSQAAAPTATTTARATPATPEFRIPTANVRRAYLYPNGKNLSAGPGKKLVAIDVEFGNFDSGLDLDDVELIDSASGQVLEAGPEIAFLRSDGTFYSWRKATPDGRMRTLLIFEVAKRVRAVRIRLWDDILTPSPIPFAPSGPRLPAERPGTGHPPARE